MLPTTWKAVPLALAMLLMLLPAPAENVPATLLSAMPVVELFVLLRLESGRLIVACVTSTAGPPFASMIARPGLLTASCRPALPV